MSHTNLDQSGTARRDWRCFAREWVGGRSDPVGESRAACGFGLLFADAEPRGKSGGRFEDAECSGQGHIGRLVNIATFQHADFTRPVDANGAAFVGGDGGGRVEFFRWRQSVEFGSGPQFESVGGQLQLLFGRPPVGRDVQQRLEVCREDPCRFRRHICDAQTQTTDGMAPPMTLPQCQMQCQARRDGNC